MAPSLTEQYQIFKLEQSQAEKMAATNNDNTMDMASYAEFQKQFSGLKEAHKAVLLALRGFWQLLARLFHTCCQIKLSTCWCVKAGV